MAEEKEIQTFGEETPEQTTEKEEEEVEEEEKQEESEEEKGEEEREVAESVEIDLDDEEDEEEIPVRFKEKEQSKEEKRLFYHIRQLQKELKELKREREEEEGFDVEGEDDKYKEVKEELARLKEELASERMLQAFLDQHPEYKRYSAKIRKYMNHPAYRNVPIGFIADGIVGQDVREDLLREKEVYDREAQRSKTGGAPSRKAGASQIDFWKMSRDEFEEYVTKVKFKRS